jgi:hypothetical protein
MKKTNSDSLRSEYKRADFGKLVRGKYAARVSSRTNVVILEPSVAKAFPSDKAVNDALRVVLEMAEATARLTLRSTGRAGTRLQLGKRRRGPPVS